MKDNENKSNLELTPHELEVLKWVQEGKSNQEIGIILDKTKWTVMYHLKNSMKKLEVVTRTQAVSRAITEGLLQPLSVDKKQPEGKTTVGIIGLGEDGATIINMMKGNPCVQIIGVADPDPNSPGVAIARKSNIPVYSDYKNLTRKDIKIIINATGSKKLAMEISLHKSANSELISSHSSRFLWHLASEKKRYMSNNKDIMMMKHESLNAFGKIIENLNNSEVTSSVLIDYVTKAMNMPAGALALFDEKEKNFKLLASKGFSADFHKHDRWEIQRGSLIGNIFNQQAPVFIKDIWEYHNMSPLLIKEGIKSLLATPVVTEGKLKGILYIGDFRKRGMRIEDISYFTLIALYAAIVIEKGILLEEAQVSRILDEVTGLYKEHYSMKVLAREHDRARDNNSSFSLIIINMDCSDKDIDIKVRKELAVIMRKVVRSYDTVGHFGYEDFCIISPGFGKDESISLIDKLFSLISASESIDENITLHCGLSTYPEDCKTVDDMIGKAEELSSRVKRKGAKVCT